MNRKIKKFIYRYNGDPRMDERVLDLQGSMPFHRVGEILFRNGKYWRVTIINEDLIMGDQRSIPVYKVFLTEWT